MDIEDQIKDLWRSKINILKDITYFIKINYERYRKYFSRSR